MNLNLKAKAEKIKLVAFDVDGVMTDGSLTFAENGMEIKTYNAKDGMGINMLNKAGIITAIITARVNETVRIRAKILDIKELFEGQKNKIEALEELCKKYNFDRVYDLVERVSSYFNVKPIIAHIERYRYLYANRNNLENLRKLGCLFQIDAAIVLMGKFFVKRAVMNLISDGFVDIVASDCHDEIRCPNLEPAYEVIEKKLGKDVCDRLKKNPYLILENVSAQKIMP